MTLALQLTRERALTYTTLRWARVHLGSRSRTLGLKLEGTNPTGSVKYRTAIGLLTALNAADPLLPGSRVIESTSGNLGIALASLLREFDCSLVAVADPKMTARTRDAIRSQGGEVVQVQERDEHGGYLLTRLAAVRELRERDPSLRWPDQYSNPANPAIHSETIATELIKQTGGYIDAVLIPVSTGGTLAGVSDGLRLHGQDTAVYAVDAAGSLVTSDNPRPHLFTGIGATRKSSFLRPRHYTRACQIQDSMAFAVCRLVLADTGLALGGSGGATVAAFVEALQSGDPLAGHRCPVALIADRGEAYQSTFYDDTWLAGHGAYEAVTGMESALRRADFGVELVGGNHG